MSKHRSQWSSEEKALYYDSIREAYEKIHSRMEPLQAESFALAEAEAYTSWHGKIKAFIDFIQASRSLFQTPLQLTAIEVFDVQQEGLRIQIFEDKQGHWFASITTNYVLSWLFIVAPKDDLPYIPELFLSSDCSVCSRRWGPRTMPDSISLGHAETGVLYVLASKGDIASGKPDVQPEQLISSIAQSVKDTLLFEIRFGPSATQLPG